MDIHVYVVAVPFDVLIFVHKNTETKLLKGVFLMVINVPPVKKKIHSYFISVVHKTFQIRMIHLFFFF